MLAAAITLLGRHGTGGASLADIGIAAGYSRGLPVHRFGTRLNLLIAVIDTIEDRFTRQVMRKIADLKGFDALVARIRMQMEAVRDMPETAIALYHLIVDSIVLLPELRPRITRLHAVYHDSLRGYLRQAQALGQLREDADIDQSVRVISGAISGMCIQALVSGQTRKLGADAEFLAQMFVRRLADGRMNSDLRQVRAPGRARRGRAIAR